MAELDGTGLGHLIEKIKAAFVQKADTTAVSGVDIDSTPTQNSSNLVTSGGVYTAVSAKYTKPQSGIPASDLASGVIPTISTNIQSDKASDAKTASPKAVYDEVHPAVATTQPAGGFAPNVLYKLGTVTGTVSFALAAAVSGIENEYKITFDAGSTAPTITWPNGVTWAGNCIDSGTGLPVVAASKHYEVSIEDNYGVIVEF